MELIKNVFFNTDKLIQNQPIKISYTGELFQNQTDDVYIHYGFGSKWDNINEIKMEKTELGFQSEILLSENETFNFCFKTKNELWDNNNGQNYIFNIEKLNTPLINKTETGLAIIGNSDFKKNKLRKSYIWTKKAKIKLYKFVSYVPKIISGNYKRRVIN
jgi:hypothetical protein